MRKEFSNLLIIAVIAIFLGACAKKSSTVQGPQILAGAPLIAEQYELVQLEGGISSTNLMVENVKWQQISGPSVSINNQTSLNANFNAPAVQTATVVSFELRITFNDKSVSTDAVSITVYKQLFSVSGVVSAADFTTVDSDLNDPYSNSISNNNTNDNFTDAQIIESPVQVGGFLTASPTGYSDDNFGASVDTKDFYKVDLLAGEEVAMIVSDTVDFDLFLYDSAEAEVDSSESGNQFEQVVAPSDGTYYIGVKVWTGTGTYLLSVAENIRIDEFDGSGVSRLSAHDDFVPNEWLVVPKLSINTALAKSGSNKVGSNKVGSNKAENYQLIKSSSLQLTAQKSVSMPLDRPAALIDKAETINKLKQLMATGDYETVELNYNYHPSIVPPNDTSYGDQWNYPLINMLTAWDTTSGANAIIAVIDTGVVLTHPDLAANLIQGYDFISSTSNSNDGNGIDADPTDPGDSQTPGESSFHGTHVSGTIAAVTDNNEGVSGIAYSAKVMPLRVLGLNGGTTNDIVQAIRYATGLPNTSGTIPANPADVINMSLGSPSSSSIFQAAITDAVAERVIVVAAAGNNGTSYKSYPGAYDGVISVSAVDRDSELASYSSYGKTIDVTAPGGDLDKNDLVVGDVDGIISTSAGKSVV